VGHAACHDGEQFRVCKRGKVRSNDQRRFRLSDKGVCRYIEGLGSARPHEPEHNPRKRLYNPLHDAKVVQDCHEGSEEYDRRKNLEGKEHTKAAIGARRLREHSKNELCSLGSESKQKNKKSAYLIENLSADVGLNDQEREKELKKNADNNQSPINIPFVGGKKIGKGGDDKKTEDTAEDG
jgi:hypothetical protein